MARRRNVRVSDPAGGTPQQKLDAPNATGFKEELQATVHVFKGGKHPLTLDEETQDPFDGYYEHQRWNPKDGEPIKQACDDWVDAHQIEEYCRLREGQRARVVAKEEEHRGDGEPGFTEVRKQEILISHGLEVEDDRAGIVEIVSRNLIIEPPFHPGVLEQLTLTNNTLNQMISAMEVNIAGTGWELLPVNTFEMEERVEDEIGQLSTQESDALEATRLEAKRQRAEEEKEFTDELDQQREGLEGFFNEPWPGVSWTTMERQVRRDMEKTGNAYVEVIRNVKGDIMFARRIDPKLMRMVRLDEPVVVEKEVERNGQKSTVSVALRERRFVEQVGGGAIIPRFRQSPSTGVGTADPDATASTLGPNTVGQTAFFTGQGIRIIYFKEFGASRELDMWLGTWAKPDEVIPMERRATEIIHRTVNESARTPYGLPRWINEIPAVLGSRKAEEFNLAFFDAGGVPPLLITIAGGTMAEKSREAMDTMLNTSNPASKHQAVVLEITGTGRMDKQNKVTIGVERFGSERTQDSLFQKYDERTGDLVRMSFRLPPVFLGDADAHNFNTVKSSYLVAEAQVFQPERDEGDEVTTLKLLRNMPNGENFRFHSLPLVIDDADQQIKCIEFVGDQGLVGGDQLVHAVNKVCGLDFQFDEEVQRAKEEADAKRLETMATALGKPKPGTPVQDEKDNDDLAEGEEEQDKGADTTGQTVEKVALKKVDGLVALGIEIAEALEGGVSTHAGRAAIKRNVELFEELSPAAKDVVERIMTMRALGTDADDVRELFGCSAAILATNAAEPELEPEPKRRFWQR